MSEAQVTIFIAEDQPIFKAGLMFMLEDFEHIRVLGDSADGKTAVDKVLELRPDVTLMDISLPQLDGISATKEIKRQWPEAKVLMLTTHENDEYIFAGLAAGADGYCLKNLTAEQLGQAITVVNSGTVWLDPGIAQRVLQKLDDPDSQILESEVPTNAYALSAREIVVLEMMVEGLSSEEMNSRLMVGLDTVESDMRNIMFKLSGGGSC